MATALIYTRRWCSYCGVAKRLLEKKQVPYEEKDATDSLDIRQEMLSRSNGRVTYPQIFINDHHVGGCDDLMALERAGKLDSLLAA